VAKVMVPFLVILFSILPTVVKAHGEEEVEQASGLFSSITISLAAILVLLIIALIYLKNNIRYRNILKIGIIVVSIALVVSILNFTYVRDNDSDATHHSENENELSFQHIHGLGFSDKGELFVPVHDGFRVYHNNQWVKPDGPEHDYMGFSMVDNGFYSSGHPDPDSDLPNPLGIVKGKDNGNTLESLTLLGEIDFHGMAVGYKSHVIYVFNPEENSVLKDVGLYYSKDDAKTWEQGALNGLESTPSSIAVHPTEEAMIAIGTDQGLYLSKDYGNTLTRLLPTESITSVAFSPNGELVVGVFRDKPVLLQFDEQYQGSSMIEIPKLNAEDPISYIAVDKDGTIAISTVDKSVYLSKDSGSSWTQIAEDGLAK
jgi:photosystem II stability/assembly factor-like uncharacterized protein